VPIDPRLLAPTQHGQAGELGCVVGDACDWTTAAPDTASISRITRPAGNKVSATSAWHSRVKSSTMPVCGNDGLRQRHPTGNRSFGAGSVRDDRHRRSGADRALRPPRRRTCSRFLAIEAAELLVVHRQSLAANEHEPPATAAPAADRCQLAQSRSHGWVVRSLAAIAHLQVMVTHCANNSAFNAATATQMPNGSKSVKRDCGSVASVRALSMQPNLRPSQPCSSVRALPQMLAEAGGGQRLNVKLLRLEPDKTAASH
jgi:hypothetical protein